MHHLSEAQKQCLYANESKGICIKGGLEPQYTYTDMVEHVLKPQHSIDSYDYVICVFTTALSNTGSNIWFVQDLRSDSKDLSMKWIL